VLATGVDRFAVDDGCRAGLEALGFAGHFAHVTLLAANSLCCGG
jgi:hypothetical protein